MNIYKHDLGGSWKLAGRTENGSNFNSLNDGEFLLDAKVPGNIELDLLHSGLIEDPYIKINAMELRKYEFYEWLYEREFDYDGISRKVELVFEGLDCCAEIFINGIAAGSCQNAMIIHKFNVTSLLKKGTNTVKVLIKSANNVFRKYPLEAATASAYPFNYEVLRMRKPAHVWGWDITPRMAIGGIFRKVYLQEIPEWRITDDHLQTANANADSALLFYSYRLEIPEFTFEDLQISIDGVCGDNVFHAQDAVWSAQGVVKFNVPSPELWFPRHYGKANLYDVSVRIMRKSTQQVLCEHKFTFGIRTIKLKAEPVWTESDTPDFQFIVNDVPVRIFGSNHVPADALHSRDIDRLPQILDMACELDCNMLRLWGGGIYEDDYFYERCDREGIMIWQDFMLGCAIYPSDEDFQKVMRDEAECIVRRLRKHPSIALWAGDNECDCATTWGIKLDPNANLITRKVFFEVCRRLDPSRPYLASSPYYSPEAVKKAEDNGIYDAMFMASEQHLWGPRDYFKSDFYKNTKSSFVSEIGYHGCPAVESIKKFISQDKNYEEIGNIEWDYHASNPFMQDNDFLNYRTKLMIKQIKELFGTVPEKLEDFVEASQICQAEAKKFFIELVRSNPKFSGVLWWNLIDCWPQFSDAVVDYYYNKKRAYNYIKKLQESFAIIITEPQDNKQKVIGCNDSSEKISGTYKIFDAENKNEISSGTFSLNAGELKELDVISDFSSTQNLFSIEWILDSGKKGENHYLCGKPPFDFERVRKILPR